MSNMSDNALVDKTHPASINGFVYGSVGYARALHDWQSKEYTVHFTEREEETPMSSKDSLTARDKQIISMIPKTYQPLVTHAAKLIRKYGPCSPQTRIVDVASVVVSSKGKRIFADQESARWACERIPFSEWNTKELAALKYQFPQLHSQVEEKMVAQRLGSQIKAETDRLQKEHGVFVTAGGYTKSLISLSTFKGNNTPRDIIALVHSHYGPQVISLLTLYILKAKSIPKEVQSLFIENELFQFIMMERLEREGDPEGIVKARKDEIAAKDSEKKMEASIKRELQKAKAASKKKEAKSAASKKKVASKR